MPKRYILTAIAIMDIDDKNSETGMLVDGNSIDDVICQMLLSIQGFKDLYPNGAIISTELSFRCSDKCPNRHSVEHVINKSVEAREMVDRFFKSEMESEIKSRFDDGKAN